MKISRSIWPALLVPFLAGCPPQEEIRVQNDTDSVYTVSLESGRRVSIEPRGGARFASDDSPFGVRTMGDISVPTFRIKGPDGVAIYVFSGGLFPKGYETRNGARRLYLHLASDGLIYVSRADGALSDIERANQPDGFPVAPRHQQQR